MFNKLLVLLGLSQIAFSVDKASIELTEEQAKKANQSIADLHAEIESLKAESFSEKERADKLSIAMEAKDVQIAQLTARVSELEQLPADASAKVIPTQDASAKDVNSGITSESSDFITNLMAMKAYIKK